jgi:hypothetical protein
MTVSYQGEITPIEGATGSFVAAIFSRYFEFVFCIMDLGFIE